MKEGQPHRQGLPGRSIDLTGQDHQPSWAETYRIGLRAIFSAVNVDAGRAIIHSLSSSSGPVARTTLEDGLSRLISGRTGEPLFIKGSEIVRRLLENMQEGQIVCREQTDDATESYFITELGQMVAEIFIKIPMFVDWVPDETELCPPQLADELEGHSAGESSRTPGGCRCDL